MLPKGVHATGAVWSCAVELTFGPRNPFGRGVPEDAHGC